ncbi:hypothetical protein [Acetobacter fabarum]|jgi:hypothetical protein|uniref:DUF2147 domain-containing protein n=1 Tax=Acetobacter fabarum TaxID=483199 RepID=A0A269XYR4_9PROT|nr:hypothetical protein [Acetobacter fabarum]PAK78408.1 hypothetical protein B8X00_06265 [Acetobacter fabarum]PEN27547.1 hypothetical protein CRM93_05315 [Acetobacter fabarum]
MNARHLQLCGYAALLGMGLAALSPARAATSAANDPYGDWTGMLVTDKGRDCPTEGLSYMQIQPKRMIFVPQMGNLVLHGVPNKERQHYHAQLILTDARKQPLPIVFEAHPIDDTFEGVYGTPTCRAHIILRRPENHPLDNFLNRN